MSIPDILLGLILPGCITGIILLLAWRPWRAGRFIDGRWAGALAIGAGYAAGYARLVGEFHFPPVEVDNWIVYFLLPAALVGALGCWLRPGPVVWLIAVMVLCGALIWLLLRPLIGGVISPGGAVLRIPFLAILMTLWWVMLNQLARRGPRLVAPAVAFLVAVGSAVVLGSNGMALRGGFPCAAMSAVLAGVLLIALISRRFTLAGGGTLAVTIVLFGTIIYGYFYIYPEPSRRLTGAMCLLLASPLLAWVGGIRRLRRRKAWQRGLVSAAAVLLGVAGAVALAQFGAETQNSTGAYVP